jgi:hypothetical protein
MFQGVVEVRRLIHVAANLMGQVRVDTVYRLNQFVVCQRRGIPEQGSYPVGAQHAGKLLEPDSRVNPVERLPGELEVVRLSGWGPLLEN